MESVVATDLVRTFRTRKGKDIQAVDGISFTVHRGELFSLLGPNGAGKTTTISMLCGLLSPTTGSVTIDGISLERDPLAARRRIGIVPQEIALYPRLTARQNLLFFGRIYALEAAELRRRVDELLEFVELSDRADDRIETFSGGMKRRINIAVGLVHRPPILYMDEPTVGVDPQSRRRILDLISHLKEQEGMAILYTTHLMEEAEELSDRVGIIDHGKLIAVGTQQELTAGVNQFDRLELELSETDIPESFVSALQAVSGVQEVQLEEAQPESGSRQLTLLVQGGRTILPKLVTLSEQSGRPLAGVRVTEPDLESVFLQLTGRALRD
jgi:ABC-2 type transport system ATP-binding protein